MSTVSIARCPDYEQDRVTAAVRRSLDLLGGISRFVKRGDRVLLKPNLLAGAAPEKAVTTHPTVLRAVIQLVKEAGGVAVAGDCCGYEGPPSPGRYYGACVQAGFRQVCEEEGVELAHLSARSVEVENPGGRAFKRFTLAKAVTEANKVITLPKLKTHGLAVLSGGVKNLFGCIPGLHKATMHLRAQGAENFSQMLVDLLLAVRPALSVMDAVVGMEGEGPRSGTPRPIGAVLASADPVALDAVSCAVVGMEPFAVPTTRIAHEQGAGVGELARIRVVGESLSSMRVAGFKRASGPAPFFRNRALNRFLQARLVARPVLEPSLCNGCWTCVEHCPAKALSPDGSSPLFDYGSCIRCYCCQELCPNGAISLREPLIRRARHLIQGPFPGRAPAPP